ncbi:DUF2490 domain-containing protein [Pontibacter virosus]|uniref:Uncharacterized protein DUF2490 n=1 Tax=Pontibacter virosus TaxID=1765052 RepID=A0A2U1B0X3_9BACT|nr:DUF2490 domain-containing protein [Pontibacter virosus]PVY42147.1 uncharacterized protein DUF2490 [Pontibacter virosus]
MPGRKNLSNNLMRGAPCLVCSFMLLLLLPLNTAAQQKEVEHDEQLWFGYMTAARISEGFSIWNDIHYIPGGFGIARTGLTTHLPHRIDLTAGYAHARLPVGGQLRRREHRPWAQVVIPTPIGGNFKLQHRLRWDLRYRQRIVAGELSEDYTFNHRARLQTVLRRNFPTLTFKGILPSLALGNELLMNLGERAATPFDQNRISLMAAARYRGLMLQTGYMNRYVQTATPGRFTSNHTLVVWLFHTLDWRREVQP